MSKIIAICNQKGGTGKTTTSINLAVYLAVAGSKTLLIDSDPQGNSTSGLGIDKNKLDKSLYDILINEASVEEVLVKTDFDNLKVIPSNIDLIGAEVELVEANQREQRLRAALEKIKDSFDYVIIDCPPSLGILTLTL